MRRARPRSRLSGRLATSGADWEYYPGDPLARRIHHLLADRILQPDWALFEIAHRATVAGEPVVIVANHPSHAIADLPPPQYRGVYGRAEV